MIFPPVIDASTIREMKKQNDNENGQVINVPWEIFRNLQANLLSMQEALPSQLLPHLLPAVHQTTEMTIK